MKKLFITISDRLKSAVPELKWIDADYGQTDNGDLRASLAFPAALLTLSIAPEELGGGSQLKNATVQVRTVFNPAGVRTSAQAPANVRENALNYLTIAEKVHNALQGFETADHTAFECTSQTQENRSDGLLVVRFSFNTTFYEFR